VVCAGGDPVVLLFSSLVRLAWSRGLRSICIRLDWFLVMISDWQFGMAFYGPKKEDKGASGVLEQ
jgi:hypothetical protein